MSTPILELRDVTKRFVKTLDLAEKLANLVGANVREEVVRAVDQVSFVVGEGEVLGLAGESGCGKSTLGRMVAGIMTPSEGSILYRGDDVATLPSEAEAAIRVKSRNPLAENLTTSARSLSSRSVAVPTMV